MVNPFQIDLNMAAGRTGFRLLIKNNSLGLDAADEEKHQSFFLQSYDNKEKMTWQLWSHFLFHIHK